MSQTQVVTSPMRQISVGKVVVNIGVGKSGEAVERARKVLEQITSQKPQPEEGEEIDQGLWDPQRRTHRPRRDHEGEGTMDLVSRLLTAREKKLASSCFDDRGSVSFGLKEHIEIPGIRYDPEIGIWGMNVSVLLERPGHRTSRRLHKPSSIGKKHVVSQEESMDFFRTKFGATIE